MSKRILIVEDDRDMREALQMTLEAGGFNISTADEAEKGILATLTEKPELILLDWRLGTGDGFVVLKNIRMYIQDIPVVVLTGIKDPDLKERILAEGVDAYLEKPCDSSILLETINSILVKKESLNDSQFFQE
ncbi:response regulator transcription factor [Candidatus Omnitrophota bacterium]